MATTATKRIKITDNALAQMEAIAPTPPSVQTQVLDIQIEKTPNDTAALDTQGNAPQRKIFARPSVATDDEDDSNESNQFHKIERYLLRKWAFRLNEVAVVVEISPRGENKWEPLNENNLYYQLFRAGYKSFKMIVETLMKNDYTRKRYNPVKEYFNELPLYDPKEGDYIQQLLSFITVEPSERNRFDVQMKKALVRTVACALRVIRFNKECVIFQGKQDDGKSSFLSSLMPKSLGTKYYYDAFNPESKDDVKRMAMCLLINIDEMASLSKKDINQIKSKMTNENIKIRLPYDARDSDLPRLATFFGTTNEEEFLTDVTGNARWVVFKILGINHDFGGPKGYSQIPIDRVWAQALYLLRNGFDFKMSIDDKKEADTVNRRYQITSVEQEYIQRYFEPDETQTSYFQTTEMVEYIRSQHVKDINLNSTNFGKALTHLKFERGSKYYPAGSKTQAKVVYAKLVERDAPTVTTPSVLDNRQAFKKQMEANMTGGDHEQRERMIENARKHLKHQQYLMEDFIKTNAPTAVLNFQKEALKAAEVALMQLDKEAVKEIPF